MRPVGAAAAILCGLIVITDLGSAIAVGLAAAAVLIASGAAAGALARLGVAAAALGGVMIAAEPYRMQRLTAFLHPGDKIGAAGYQLYEAKLALGAGGLFGVGLGQSVTKLSYLPEAHTDMIVPIVGEELGLIGVLGLLVAFGLLAWCGYSVALRAKDPFGKLLAAGLTTLIAGQAVLNIGGTLGVLPFTGVPVPLISYGGTSLIATLAGDRARALGRHLRRAGAARRGSGAQHGPQARARRRPASRSTTTGGSAPGDRRRCARAAPPGDVTTRRVLVAAGGTAGHVMPALAVAEELVRAGAEVTFAGTPSAPRPSSSARPATRSTRSPCADCRAGRRSASPGRSRWTSPRPSACIRILRRRAAARRARRRRLRRRADAAGGARARHPARADRGRCAPRPRQPPGRAARRSRLPRLPAAGAQAAALRGRRPAGAARVLRDHARRGARRARAAGGRVRAGRLRRARRGAPHQRRLRGRVRGDGVEDGIVLHVTGTRDTST